MNLEQPIAPYRSYDLVPKPSKPDKSQAVRSVGLRTKLAVYGLFGITLLGLVYFCLIKASDESRRVHDINILRFAPNWDEQTILAKGKAIETQMLSGKVPGAKEHFALLAERARLFDAIDRAILSRTATQAMYDLRLRINTDDSQYLRNVNDIVNKDQNGWTAEQKEYQARLEQSHSNDLRPDYTKIRFWATWLSIFAIPCVFLCFLVQLWERKAQILAELVYPRIYLWAIIWPIGIFRFIKGFDPKNQWARARAFGIFVASAALTCAAGGINKSSSEESKDGGADKVWIISGNTMTLSKYIGDNGFVPHNGPVQWFNFSVTHKRTGCYGALFNSRQFTTLKQPDFGSEADIMAGCTNRLLGFNVGGELNFVMLAPVEKTRGVLQATGSIGKDLHLGKKNTVTAFFVAQHVNPVRGSTLQAGTFLRIGLSHAVNLNAKYGLNSTIRFSHDDGVFGFHPGWFAIASATGNYKINDRMSLMLPVAKANIPLTIGDRPKALSLGAGISMNF